MTDNIISDPCPFCGGYVVIKYAARTKDPCGVTCTTCNIDVIMWDAYDTAVVSDNDGAFDKIVSLWNRRYSYGR